MKIKQLLTVAIIIIGFVVSFALCFIAIAANDTPHNASNHIDCGSCHGEGLLQSFWGGSGLYSTYDELCLSCHTETSGGPYTDKSAPWVMTHSDAGGSALAECRDCHNPHYQRQKVYKNTDANNLYLATGKIQSCEYSGKDPLTNKDISTFYYSDNPPITYKTGTGWDASKLSKKTEDYRGAILFPNIGKLGYNYPITAVDPDPDTNTITVNGNLTTECSSSYFNSTTFAVIYGQYIKDSIDVSTDGSGIYSAVKFFDKKGQGSFAYDESGTGTDSTPNGVCQVCHTDQANPTNPTHWRADGTGADHYNNYSEGCNYSKGCTQCHSHTKGFFHGGPCIECHGHDAGYEYDTEEHKYSDGDGTFQSHSTHTENDSDDLKGPNITCGDCHDTSNYPYFKSGTDSNGDGKINLSETDVCDTCHSPGGAYDGVNDSVIGAKNNWCQGVYEGNLLRTGKENWCLGCHDDAPASIKSVPAPNVAGDNVNYGYNVTGHGIYGNPSITCSGCHDASIAHIDGNARTYSSASNNYQSGYRLAEGMAIPRSSNQNVATAFNLCFTCHDSTPFLTETSSETNFIDDNKIDPERGAAPWNFHWEHLKKSSSTKQSWDSDYDWPVDSEECEDYQTCCDSGISCTTCHNVHGSPCIVGTSIVTCADPVKNPMIRHGELISTPGTSDRVPAFQFHWYDGDNNPVTDFNSSKTGGLRVGNAFNINTGYFPNYVCWGCHSAGERQYTREPRSNIQLIDESFEKNPGYDESWTEPAGNPDEDSDLPSCTPPACTPPSGAGLQCLKSSLTAGYEAYAKRDYGTELPRTRTSFYLYVETEDLAPDSNKNIGILENNSGINVLVFRLNKNGTQLRFNIRVYDNGWKNSYFNISTGVWYKIDVKYDNIDSVWEWRVNGETQLCNGGCTLGGAHYSGIRTWNFGFMGTGTSITGIIYYDLIKVNTMSYE
jgi:hypothetical protein